MLSGRGCWKDESCEGVFCFLIWLCGPLSQHGWVLSYWRRALCCCDMGTHTPWTAGYGIWMAEGLMV